MTLTETVVASLVFSLTATASVHVLNLVSVSVLDLERRQQRLDQLEAGLVASESLLRSESRQAAPVGDCQQAAGRLLAILQSSSPKPGLSRDLSLTASGEMLQLTLAVAGLGQARHRTYHPAAFGLCPSLSAQEVARAPS
jgi:type II secretory pathway component PulJ